MLEKLGHRLTYANVMASIAIFIALGGGAYAITLPRNSVTAKQIAPRAVGSSEAHNLTLKDFKRGQLPDTSSKGQPGTRGPQGAAGAPGPAGGFGQLTYTGKDFYLTPGQLGLVSVTCPGGQHVVGGGVLPASPAAGEVLRVHASYPEDLDNDGLPDDGWGAVVKNNGASNQFLFAEGICAPVASVSG